MVRHEAVLERSPAPRCHWHDIHVVESTFWSRPVSCDVHAARRLRRGVRACCRDACSSVCGSSSGCWAG
eukprot:7375987-Prymnesium_polylepis.1